MNKPWTDFWNKNAVPVLEEPTDIEICKRALQNACVRIAQLNVRDGYVTITDEVMPSHWIERAKIELTVQSPMNIRNGYNRAIDYILYDMNDTAGTLLKFNPIFGWWYIRVLNRPWEPTYNLAKIAKLCAAYKPSVKVVLYPQYQV